MPEPRIVYILDPWPRGNGFSQWRKWPVHRLLSLAESAFTWHMCWHTFLFHDGIGNDTYYCIAVSLAQFCDCRTPHCRYCSDWNWNNQTTGTPKQGLYLLSGKTSYCQISWSLEAARLDVIIVISLWNSTEISAAALPRYLSNFRAIRRA